MTDIYFYQLSETACWNNFEPRLPLISAQRRKCIGRMPSASNRILSFSAELLLRRIACERLHVPNESLRLSKEEHGKPFLLSHEDFFFNWSHTKNALALAVSSRPVGIDIESCPPRGDVHKLAARFFTKKEASYVSEETSVSDVRFCEIWTRKEAYLKYTGCGLTLPLDSFDVLYDDAVTARLATIRRDRWFLTLCCDSTEHRLTELTERDVLDAAQWLQSEYPTPPGDIQRT